MDSSDSEIIKREKRSRLGFALTLPISVILLIVMSGAITDITVIVLHNLKVLQTSGLVPGAIGHILLSLTFLGALAALAGLILWRLYRLFAIKFVYVLAICLAGCALFVWLLPDQMGSGLTRGSLILVFLLAAAQAALQLALLPLEEKYRNPVIYMLCLLVLLGCWALLTNSRTHFDFSAAAYLILLLMYGFLHILSMKRQENIRVLQMTLRDTAKTGSLKMALGADGIKELLPYFSRQMQGGNSAAKLLILELVKGIEFKEKQALVKSAFKTGPLEVRFNIIDQIFNWNLPYELLPYMVEICTDEYSEYLVRGIFRNYCDIWEHRMLAPVVERGTYISRDSLSAEGRLMYGYVFEKRKENYERIIDCLLNSGRKEDRLLVSEIMAGFVGTEDDVNRKYLDQVIEGARLNPEELEEMIEMCAEYDDSLEYLKNELSNYYSYSFIKTICEYYEPTRIVKSFNNSAMPVSIAMILYAATCLDQGSLTMYYSNVERLLSYLTGLSQEASKIKTFGHQAGPLLLDEIKTLKLNMAAILLDYVRVYAGYPKTGDMSARLQQSLADGDLEELLQVLPEKAGQTLKEILTGDLPPDEQPWRYEQLRVSDNNPLLENIYKYLGGESLDSTITANIENLIALKSIPMFRELDVFTLQQIQKISVYQEYNAGETIVTEGEKGESLFVILNGKVGVYKNGKMINEIQFGGLFGEMAVIDRQKRTATIKTLEGTSFLVISGDDFMRLLDRNSSISKSVIRTLAERMRKMLES